MSVKYSDFQGEIVLLAKIHYANPNLSAELQAVATALESNATTHDKTIETPAAALQIGATQTRLTNDLLLLVNTGLGGNLPSASMAAAIDGVIGVLAPPGVIDVPYVSGTGTVGQALACTQGNWAGTPTSYAYQWKRDGTNVGTNANSYTLVAGDSGHNVGCVVTATNAQGSTAAPLSNTVHCA